MSRLAIVGLTARDRVDGGVATAGGAPFHCVQALRELDSSARVVTRVAGADRGLLESLPGEVVWREASETAAYSLAYDAATGRRRVSIDALGDPWDVASLADWVMPALEGCATVHAGALSASDFPVDSLALLSASHRVSLDGQGLVRPARLGPVTLERPASLDVLAHVDVLKLSLDEAEALGVEPTAASLGALRVPEVVLTAGERGAWILAAGALVEIKADPVHVRDTTGAGDGFIACYLHGRLGGARGAQAGELAARAVAAMLRRRAR